MVIDRMEKNEADEGRGSLREVKECNLDRMAEEATLEQRRGGPEQEALWRAGGTASRKRSGELREVDEGRPETRGILWLLQWLCYSE